MDPSAMKELVRHIMEDGFNQGDMAVVFSKEISRFGEFDYDDLRNTIGLRRSGESVQIAAVRDGKRKKFNAELQELASMQQMAAEDIHEGLAGAELADYAEDIPRLGKGAVRVDGIAAGSPAAMRGLEDGDLIISVNRVRVRAVKEMQEAANGQNLLILGIRRGSRDLLLQVK